MCCFVVFGVGRFKEFYCALVNHVFLVLFSILVTSLGEERAGIDASSAFVCFSYMS